MNNRKCTDVGIFQDFLPLISSGVGGERVADIGIAVKVDAAGNQHGQQAQPRTAENRGKTEPRAQQIPSPQGKRNDRPDQREGAEAVPHVPRAPRKLRHGDGGEHGKRHGDGFQYDHGRLPFNMFGRPHTISTARSARAASSRFRTASVRI